MKYIEKIKLKKNKKKWENSDKSTICSELVSTTNASAARIVKTGIIKNIK